MFAAEKKAQPTFHVEHSHALLSGVSRETLEKLHAYEKLLLRWTATVNLIGRGKGENLWVRHFEDCLQLIPLLPEAATCGIDMGAGAGFPGLVLAIASGVHFHLVEADHRKSAFLREVIAATGASATVHAVRLELLDIEPADLLTARALAPLGNLLKVGERFLKKGGTALFQKGSRAEAEIAAAEVEWDMKIVRHISVTNSSAVILEITGLSRAARR